MGKVTTSDFLLKFEIPEIIFGTHALSQVGYAAERLGGERILLVTDPGIVEAGWVDEACKYLEKSYLNYVIYDNVVTNPRDFQVEQGADLYHEKDCDVIVALGGGSPMDTAKGIAILVTNGDRINRYVGCNLIDQPIPPLICVPTTAGTGSDVSQFAIITDTQKNMKVTILSRAIMPDISLVDPSLLQTKPPELIAATGMDALTHAIEAYVSSLSWAMTDPHAYHAITLVVKNLTTAVSTRQIQALEAMAIASLEGGIAFSNAILGAVHALAHPLGGIYDIHHGLANSILLPAVVRRNLYYALRKYAEIATAMGADTQKMTTKEAAELVPVIIQQFVDKLHLPSRLSELGVPQDDIPKLASLARDDLCMLTNPRNYTQEEIEEIYNEVW